MTRIAIVTGGRRGIGASIATELARVGFNVLVVDLERDERAEEVLSSVTAQNVRADFLTADISDIETHHSILDAAQSLGGRLSCLVNNAGVTSLVRGDMLELTPASFDRVMNINLRGAFFLSQAFARALLVEQDRTGTHEVRSIINITSANAELLGLDRADYTLSKSAMSMMTRLFAGRLARHHINVYEIRPGMIRTDMTAPVAEKYEKFLADGGIPFGRWGEPVDIGSVAAQLANGALPFTTGDFIWVDGGLSLRM